LGLAIRLSLQDSDVYRDGRAWWRSERKIRAAIGGRPGALHIPDAQVSWPEVPGSAYGGECWAIEAELTPKPPARTTASMAGLLARTTDYDPAARPGPGSPSGSCTSPAGCSAGCSWPPCWSLPRP